MQRAASILLMASVLGAPCGADSVDDFVAAEMERWSYSNTAYVLAGIVVHRAGGARELGGDVGVVGGLGPPASGELAGAGGAQLSRGG